MEFEPHLANPERLALEVLAEVLAPPPPVDLRAWAMTHLTFAEGPRAGGRYVAEDFPFFDRLFEVLSPDHPCRIVSLKKGAQLGGTVVAMIFAAASTDLDPAQLLYVHPTEPNARRWMRLKFKPFIKGVERLRTAFATERGRDASGTGFYIERRDGRATIQLAGAASPSSLSEISVKRQVQDDLAKWPEDNGAGDPEGQADSRSKAFDDAKIFKVSTPLVAESCKITKSVAAGTDERWHVACPHCGKVAPLDWDSMRIALESGEADPDDPCFVCPTCHGHIHEYHRPRFNDPARGARWVAKHPERDGYHVSFELPSYLSPLARWPVMAHKWLSVRGDPNGEQAFYNDWLGRAYNRAGEAPPAELLYQRAEEHGHRRGIIPLGYPLLTIGIDCQGDRVEAQVVAWGRNRHRAVVDYLVIGGHITDDAARADLDRLMARKWPNEAGGLVEPDLVAIDANVYTDDVYAWVKRHPASRLVMVRGAKGDGAEIIAPVRRDAEGKGRRSRVRTFGNRFYNVGVSSLKATLYEFLKRTDPLARGHVAFARGLGLEYFAQLTSETRQEVVTSGGRKLWRWKPKPNAANEALDNMNYAEAAAVLRGLLRYTDADWDALAAEREKPPAGGQQLDLEHHMLTAPPKPARSAPVPPPDPPAAPPASGRGRDLLSRLA